MIDIIAYFIIAAILTGFTLLILKLLFLFLPGFGIIFAILFVPGLLYVWFLWIMMIVG